MAVQGNGGLFGTNAKNQPNQTQELKKAQFWLNIGYGVEVDVRDDEGNVETEQRFVSLPMGIPLDTMEHLKMTKNTEFNQLQSARNDLLDQILAAAEKLQPGESKTLRLDVEVRRVQGEMPAVEAKDNPFALKLEL